MQDNPVECEHKYVHISTHYQRESYPNGANFIRNDVYFCERCLKQSESTKSLYVDRNDQLPIWWQH
jgi:hypothetical protein